MNSLRLISRILLGLLFIFSGFVKGVDPIGTQYKIADYFIAYGMNWAIPSALYLSFFLNMFEFLMGVLVLLNVRIRLVSWLVLIMMIYFTVITFFDALYNPVPDCGCFGDAIKLTNWQTFWKNVFIMPFVIILFSSRNIIRPTFTFKGELIITIVFTSVFLGFEVYNLRNLPIMDFSDWKIGNRLAPENPLPLKYYVTYKNINTGAEKEFLSPNYPYNDSVWMSQWKFKEQRIEDPNPKSVNIIIEDTDKNNLTDNIIRNPHFQFIVVAWDLAIADKASFKKIDDISKLASADGYSLVVLTSSLPEAIEKFRMDNNISNDLEFMFADDTSLQGIIRANPGMLIIKNSVVLAKWHWRNIPDYANIKQSILNKM